MVASGARRDWWRPPDGDNATRTNVRTGTSTRAASSSPRVHERELRRKAIATSTTSPEATTIANEPHVRAQRSDRSCSWPQWRLPSSRRSCTGALRSARPWTRARGCRSLRRSRREHGMARARERRSPRRSQRPATVVYRPRGRVRAARGSDEPSWTIHAEPAMIQRCGVARGIARRSVRHDERVSTLTVAARTPRARQRLARRTHPLGLAAMSIDTARRHIISSRSPGCIPALESAADPSEIDFVAWTRRQPRRSPPRRALAPRDHTSRLARHEPAYDHGIPRRATSASST